MDLTVSGNDILDNCCAIACPPARTTTIQNNLAGGNCESLADAQAACIPSGVMVSVEVADGELCSGEMAMVQLGNVANVPDAAYTFSYTLTLPDGTTTTTQTEDFAATDLTVTGGATTGTYSFSTVTITSDEPTDEMDESLTINPISLVRTDDNGDFGCEQTNFGTPATVVVLDPISATFTFDPATTDPSNTDPVLCQGGMLDITAAAIGGENGTYTYTWSLNAAATSNGITISDNGPTATLNGTNILNPAATNGTVTVVITDNTTCTAFTEILPLTLSPAPALSFNNTGSNTLCDGDSRVLQIGGTNIPATSTIQYTILTAGISGSFSPATTTFTTNQTTLTLTDGGEAAGAMVTIQAVVTTPDGCQDTETIELTLYPALTATVSGNTTACLDGSQTFQVTLSGGNGSYDATDLDVNLVMPTSGNGAASQVFSAFSATGDASVFDITFTPTPADVEGQQYTFTVDAEDGVGCTATSAPTTITLDGPNDATVMLGTGGSATVCSNENISGEITVSNASGTYQVVLNVTEDGTPIADVTITGVTSGTPFIIPGYDNATGADVDYTFTIEPITEEGGNACSVRDANESGSLYRHGRAESGTIRDSDQPERRYPCRWYGRLPGLRHLHRSDHHGRLRSGDRHHSYSPALASGQTTFTSGESITQDFPIGITTLTFTVADGNSNMDSDNSFVVTVADDEDPSRYARLRPR